MKKIRYRKRIRFLCLIFMVLCTHHGLLAQGVARDTLIYRTAVSLYELDKIKADINFIIESDRRDSITIEVFSDIIIANPLAIDYDNILLYKVDLTRNGQNWNITPTTYGDPAGQLGVMGVDYPHPWVSNDIKSSATAVKNWYVRNDWSVKNKGKVFLDIMGSTIPVEINIMLSGKPAIQNLKMPGIGYVFINFELNKGLRFDPESPLHNKVKGTTLDEWYGLKNPPDTSDLKLAAHRGFWGDNLGAGPIENTEPSIQAALPYTNIIEADVMITKDKQVVVSHDYNLQRLTEFTDPDQDNIFIYDLNYNQIKDLHLRKRNFEIDNNFKVVQLTDLINYIRDNNTVLTIDIKEITKRLNPINNQCTAACDLTRDMQAEAWIELVSKILEVVKEMNAWQYVAIKTPYTLNRIKKSIPQEQYRDLSKVLFFPVYYSNREAKLIVSDINDWYNNAPNYLMAIETHFKKPGDVMLNPYEGYENIMHYVIAETGLRPGLYSEEPGGAKGIVERYAQWRFKDLTQDFRGDPYWLMDIIPYFSTAVVTTDRPDIWKVIKAIYEPANTYSSASFVTTSNDTQENNITEIVDVPEIKNINALYVNGEIVISGLDKKDINTHIFLFNLQGQLILQNKVIVVPQMRIPKALSPGVYILKLQGNRERSIKLEVK